MALTEERIRIVLNNIGKLSGVESVVLADERGFPLSSTISSSSAEKISALVSSAQGRLTQMVHQIGFDDLKMVSLRTGDREIVITPYGPSTLIVIRRAEADSTEGL